MIHEATVREAVSSQINPQLRRWFWRTALPILFISEAVSLLALTSYYRESVGMAPLGSQLISDIIGSLNALNGVATLLLCAGYLSVVARVIEQRIPFSVVGESEVRAAVLRYGLLAAVLPSLLYAVGEFNHVIATHLSMLGMEEGAAQMLWIQIPIAARGTYISVAFSAVWLAALISTRRLPVGLVWLALAPLISDGLEEAFRRGVYFITGSWWYWEYRESWFHEHRLLGLVALTIWVLYVALLHELKTSGRFGFLTLYLVVGTVAGITSMWDMLKLSSMALMVAAFAPELASRPFLMVRSGELTLLWSFIVSVPSWSYYVVPFLNLLALLVWYRILGWILNRGQDRQAPLS